MIVVRLVATADPAVLRVDGEGDLAERVQHSLQTSMGQAGPRRDRLEVD
jgi:hypothetical protein